MLLSSEAARFSGFSSVGALDAGFCVTLAVILLIVILLPVASFLKEWW